MMSAGNCWWCGCTFTPHRGGSEQRFCSSRHRSEFHTAARLWAERALAVGVLTIDSLKNGDPAAYTLPMSGEAPEAMDESFLQFDALIGRVLMELPKRELEKLPDLIWDLLEHGLSMVLERQTTG